jgi:hypothetical protein
VADLDVKLIDAEDFLEIVWGDREGWIDLPSKAGKYWIPWHDYYSGEVDGFMTHRIDDCIKDGESLYFSAALFSARGRRFGEMLNSWWLWADLDEISPSGVPTELMPTIAWETSPGRYQAMWKLVRAVSGVGFDKVNRALSYHLGADHGGWDRTQVLRLPGTVNFKYAGAPLVRLLWVNELVYDARSVWALVKESSPGGEGIGREGKIILPRKAMPASVRSLLTKEVSTGQRSNVMWRAQCGLAEAGWNADEIYNVLWQAPWNKWRDVNSGRERMQAEIRKAINWVLRKAVLNEARRDQTPADTYSERVGAVDRSGDGSADLGRGDEDTGERGSDPEYDAGDDARLVLPWRDYWSFMGDAMDDPKWLIRGIWTAGSQGILGGEPKTSKTTLALGIAMSVASGQPLFGDPQYKVTDPGPVIFVQEENAPWLMQDRMRKIAGMLGLLGEVRENGDSLDIAFPQELPITLLNNYGLDLTREEHRDALWLECEKKRPRLVVLDPLYLVLAGVNFNQAHELAPYLKWVLDLSNEFKCSVMIIHHFRKAQQNASTEYATVRPGQRLMGNATLHGFVDSGLYTEQGSPDPSLNPRTLVTRVYREFRSVEPQKSLEFAFKIGRGGSGKFEATIEVEDYKRAIRDMIRQQPGITLRQLSSESGLHKGTILEYCRTSKWISMTSTRRGRSGIQYSLYPTENGDSQGD